MRKENMENKIEAMKVFMDASRERTDSMAATDLYTKIAKDFLRDSQQDVFALDEKGRDNAAKLKSDMEKMTPEMAPGISGSP